MCSFIFNIGLSSGSIIYGWLVMGTQSRLLFVPLGIQWAIKIKTLNFISKPTW